MTPPPRIWISNSKPARGELVRVRAQVEHVMESGLRTDAEGRPRPRNIVRRFEARLGPVLLLTWEPGIGIAQNPYIEFTFVARDSAELKLSWVDDQGLTQQVSKAVVLTPASG
ncbi:thiosulfate oxidation carrier complex protein SoxZ [Rubrivivax gelatinosus]|uniref:Thiosulfate oxidation carrier complex protein SoxZ n=1 Tax=Rubrivivax gelatinosus TaxID=28068 RepID=A0ABS1DXQ7_RUBGE|nr:thiosulfate oxidation carrier complex protein SoxZ [Rubrivivax gelatinosus]MBK1615629.1 thiosulfate oxidation carrier complex protein SoxZ [Rubrivivax gelatinosus]MBK1714524.1 thiosulfate oxidation carrier complex protein SoxZ [Rubrivivax gelatinosus]